MRPETRTAARIAAHLGSQGRRTALRPLAYAPRPGSVAWALLAFFARNPDEELTIVDAEVKFSTTAHSLHSGTKAARNAGYINARFASNSIGPGLTVYSAGPELHTVLAHMHELDPTVPAQQAASA